MATAKIHLAEVGGYVGPARCFAIDPPREFEGIAYQYVTICLQPRIGGLSAEVKVYPADSSGACATRQLVRRVGSFTIDGDAIGDPAYENGCYTMALALLGGYEVVAEGA